MDYDVMVVGGGSGGFGAALAAARAGSSVLLVEQHAWLGGTSTHGGVNGWEAGVGGSGIPFDLYRRLKQIPLAVGIYRIGRHCCWPDEGAYPGGENLIDPTRGYADTLIRQALGPLSLNRREDRPLIRQRWNGVIFEPEAMARAMEDLLRETWKVDVVHGVGIQGVDHDAGLVREITLTDGRRITPRYVIDATGDGVVYSLCGYRSLRGQDAHGLFGEPGAPEHATDKVNGVTLIFRARPAPHPGIEPGPADVPHTCWWRSAYPAAHVVHYPNGDLNVNMLPTMDGEQYLGLGPDAAYVECERRVRAFWHHAQTHFPEWREYRLNWVAPTLGVRESKRIWCERMLTQHDIEAGLEGQKHADIVTIADHPIDVHGAHGKGCVGTQAAYGIPYRCLVPRGARNLLIASRAAGFSAIAAASCRLSRTIMQLGQAAGTACALARNAACDLPHIPPAALRQELRRQHVCLEFPPRPEIVAHLGRE